MISETIIEQVIAQMETEDFKDQFATEQSEYWHYLNSDGFKGLTEAEHQLSFFINSVIYHSAKESGEELEDVDIELFQQMEEENWNQREAHNSWPETKDVFFDNYSQEDLLAFVEDMLEDEEEAVSELSKEVIFITAKSYVDYLMVDE